MPAISVPSGTNVNAGRPRWPAWRQGMTPNTWTALGGQIANPGAFPSDLPYINGNYPPRQDAPWLGNNGLADVDSIHVSWVGGGHDKDRCRLFYWGGGHNAYAGNEIYVLDYALDVPRWAMSRWPAGSVGNPIEPWETDGLFSTGAYSNGERRSSHTYDLNVIDPDTGDLYICPGMAPSNPSGGVDFTTWRYGRDFTWEKLADAAAWTTTLGTGGACYDPTRKCLYFIRRAGGHLERWTIGGNAWTRISGVQSSWGSPIVGYTILEYDPRADAVIQYCYATGFHLGAWSDLGGTAVWQTLADSGTWPSDSNTNVQGFTYDPSRDVYYVYAQTTNGEAGHYVVTPPDADGAARLSGTWSIAYVAADPSNVIVPPEVAGAGVYNSFTYCPRMDGIFLQHQTLEQTHFKALS